MFISKDKLDEMLQEAKDEAVQEYKASRSQKDKYESNERRLYEDVYEVGEPELSKGIVFFPVVENVLRDSADEEVDKFKPRLQVFVDTDFYWYLDKRKVNFYQQRENAEKAVAKLNEEVRVEREKRLKELKDDKN